MKNAPNQSKTPSIESTMLKEIENNYAGVLIPARQVLFECPVAEPRILCFLAFREHDEWTEWTEVGLGDRLLWIVAPRKLSDTMVLGGSESRLH
jgi:hypothetical protein